MAKVKDSEYQFNSPFSLSKRIVCYLIDSLLLILAVILCFQATDILYGNYNARLKELTADMTAEQERLIECFSGSGLMLYDEEEGVAVEDELMGQYFVYSLVLSTLGEDVSDASAYEGEYIFSDMGTTNRSVIYYYTDFKPAHAADYTGYDESEAGAEYAAQLFLSACGDEGEGYFGETFPLLDKNVATALDRLISDRENSCEIDGETYYGREIFIALYNAFIDVLDGARTEFTQTYRPFAEFNENFSSLRDELIKIKTGEICLAYFIGAFICFLAVPLACGGNTAAVLLLRGRCIQRSGLKMCWYNKILRWIWHSLFYFSNIMFVLLLTYDRYASFFLMGSIAGGLKFYMFCLAPIVIMLISFAIFAFDKSERRTLTDRLSLTVVKEKE